MDVMIRIYVPFFDEEGNSCREAYVYLSHDGEQYYYEDVDSNDALNCEDNILSSVACAYGDWLCENNITGYKIRIKYDNISEERTKLTPYIEFTNAEDATAFTLTWM